MKRRDFLKAFLGVAAGITVPVTTGAAQTRLAALQRLLASAPRWKRSMRYQPKYRATLVFYYIAKSGIGTARWFYYARLVDDPTDHNVMALVDADALRAFQRAKVL